MTDNELGKEDTMLNNIQDLKSHQRYCQIGDCEEVKSN